MFSKVNQENSPVVEEWEEQVDVALFLQPVLLVSPDAYAVESSSYPYLSIY